MDRPNIKNFKNTPERIIQNAIIDMLKLKDWYVMETHGNMFQRGFPDLYATHTKYAGRFIEVKNPDGYSFTAAQLECFPKLIANGTNIFILTAATEDEYQKLFRPCNYWQYITNFRSLNP
jgi:hypothetical protein